ncbi:gp58-like family protein [Ligilactobacillus ruminis]|uniref:gp58-like family protein n=1 Tax=Ligilactobacillus ruminis TaxID=1623 RepID=UPI0022E20787|nr:gp58-like family protein [Ligilactobacillus ruminis]
MDSGNYIVLQDDGGKTWLFTILDYEETQYTKTVYAEDAGIELLNKACDIWKSSGPHSFEYYFNLVTSGTPWKLGVNQLAGLERTLTYEGRDTGLGRLLSILKGFDNAECTFDVAVKMNAPSEFKINVYKSVGNDRSDVQMVYNHELDNITKKESRAEFVTALCGVGGTIQTEDGQGNTQDAGNVDFADLEYNKDGLVTTKGDKFLRAVDANKRFNPGQTTYIEAFYEYDTQSPSELLNRTITRLKTYSEPQYTYTADVKVIDNTLKIGDTVTIIDHDYNPALYLSARVAKLEKTYTDPSQNTIEFCNYRLLSSRLADKLARLQTVVNKMPSASQVGKLESNVSNLAQKQEELSQEIVSANGKNTNFYGKTEPANPKNGDLWYKKLENGEIEMYQYQGGVWQLLASTADLTTVQTELDQAKSDMAQAKTDAQNAYDEAIKATNTANGAKAQTDEALKQAKQANDNYTALAKEVADNKASVDADYQKAQADIAQAQKDLSNVTDTVTEVKKGQGELSAKVAGKVDNTVYQTYVKQTNQSLSEKLVASDLNGYAKTVDVTKSIDGVKTTIADNTGKISTMQTDINGIKTNVKNAQGDISSLQTDAKSIKATVSNNTGKITQLTADVNGVKSSVSSKVDKSTYNSYVSQTDKALSAKLTESDLRGYAKTTDLEARAGKIEASLTSLQGSVSYKATTLVDKPEFSDGDVGGWVAGGKPVVLYKTGAVNGYLYNIQSQNIGNDLYASVYWKPVASGSRWYAEVLVPNFDSSKNISVGVYLHYINPSTGKSAWQLIDTGKVTVSPGRWGWIKGYVTVPDGVTKVRPCISMQRADGTNIKSAVKYCQFTLVNAGVQNQLTTLSGKITATSDRLSSVYTKSETDAKLKTKVEQSALTQTSNNLSASITKNSKILSSAGLVNENAYINANRIALNGKTLMSNATINDAFIGNMSANKITTGTLNAAKVNLINVNASNISTGTLNGIKITSTGKDPSGTSSTTKIESGYIDTNVINCSDYIMVGKADPDPRKRWQTKQDSFGMWFTTPAKISGHTGNANSDWQSELQGFIGGQGWNYKSTTVTGNGQSGIQLALTPQQIWGRPYGGDQWMIGNWIGTETSHKTGNIMDGTLSPVMWYSYTGRGCAYTDQLVIEKKTQFFDKANFQGGVRIGITGANHGIRTAWVSWSDWGSNQKIPCIVQDKDNWGGIAFPANGRVVLFTHSNRINTDGLPKDKVGSYNGWGG